MVCTCVTQLAYLLAAALAMECMRGTGGDEQALSRIQALLAACRNAADKRASAQPDASLEFCMLLVSGCVRYHVPTIPTVQEFEVAVLVHDEEAQLAAVQHLKHVPGVHTHTLLRCASMAAPCSTVLAAVYAAALAVELQREEPDVAVVAAIARHQAECAAEDAELLRVVHATSKVVEETGKYPVEVGGELVKCYSRALLLQELQWMVCTCWNRGAQHAQFGRYAAGHACMHAALLLMHHLPSALWQDRRAELKAAADAVQASAQHVDVN